MISVSCPSARHPLLTVSTGLSLRRHTGFSALWFAKTASDPSGNVGCSGPSEPPHTPGVCQDPVRTPVSPPQLFGTSSTCSLFLGPSGLPVFRAAQTVAFLAASGGPQVPELLFSCSPSWGGSYPPRSDEAEDNSGPDQEATGSAAAILVPVFPSDVKVGHLPRCVLRKLGWGRETYRWEDLTFC